MVREFGTGLEEGTGITVLSNGNIVVADFKKDTVCVYDSNGTSLFGFGGHGSGNGQFECPINVAHDDSDNIYVVEMLGATRVQKFDKNGNYQNSWKVGAYHRGLVYQNGALYITSTNSKLLKIHVATGSQDSISLNCGGTQYGIAAFKGLLFVANDSDNTIYVVDTLGLSVRTWGGKTKQWPEKIVKGEIGKFASAINLDVSSDGLVFVCDANGGRVQVFDTTGVFIKQFGYGTFEKGNEKMIIDDYGYAFGSGFNYRPKGIALGTRGQIYVLLGSKIMQFSMK